MSNEKIAASLGAGITAVALGVAVFQYSGKRDAEGALAVAQRQLQGLQSELANVSARVAQAERRATEAERDSGDLLKAVEATRVQQAARAARTAANSGARLPGPPAVMRTPDDEERLAQERSYQQALTKRRAEEAIARAKIDQDVATQSDPA